MKNNKPGSPASRAGELYNSLTLKISTARGVAAALGEGFTHRSEHDGNALHHLAYQFDEIEAMLEEYHQLTERPKQPGVANEPVNPSRHDALLVAQDTISDLEGALVTLWTFAEAQHQ